MPSSSQVHVNAPLTNMSLAVLQEADQFAAGKMFPSVRVKKQGDVYFVYSQEDFLRDEAKLRSPATESAGGDYDLAQETYFCSKWAFHKDISEEERTNADDPLDPDRDAMRFVMHKLLIRKELNFAESFLKPGVWGKDYKGGQDFTQWSTDGSTPVMDVETWLQSVESQTGFRPNRMLVGTEVLKVLKGHKDILDRVKYTQRGVVTTELLAGLFGVEMVLVGQAIYNKSNVENSPNYAYAVPSKSVLMVYAPKNPGLRTPSAGYHFVWTGLPGVNEEGFRILKFHIDERLADRIEGEVALTAKIVAPTLGVYAYDVVA